MLINFIDVLPTNEDVEKYTKGSDVYCEKNDDSAGWLWNGSLIDQVPLHHQSFVYLFTNNITKKRYIGFKTFISKTRKKINKKQKTIVVESDWKDYYSSSVDVLQDVFYYGKGNFTREILAFTVNKAIGKYVEAWFQFQYNALLDPGFYNGIVNLRINKNSVITNKDKVVFADSVINDLDHYLSIKSRWLSGE